MGRGAMPYQKPSESRKIPAASTKRLGMLFLVLLAIAAIGLLIRSFLPPGKAVTRAGRPGPAVASSQEPADASSELDGTYYGLCRKQSVHSVGDFYNTVRNDPVLKAHFAGFNWDAARLGKQERDVWAYVSYRKGDLIRRTSKPVRLPRGDGYVTDGTRVVRTYCCNDYVLASHPVRPVERVDAPPRRMYSKSASVDELPQESASWPPAEDATPVVPESLESLHGDGEPLRFHPPGPAVSPHSGGNGDLPFRPYSSPKNNGDHVVTPEPGTVALVGAGAGLFVLFRLLRRRRA